MVYRLYVEKKPGLAFEAASLLRELQELPEVQHLEGLRLLNRYDADNIDPDLFERCINTVFSEPQTDHVCFTLPEKADAIFAVEYLPGQFDQRADSAAQCIQLISEQERPLIRTAKVLLLQGPIEESELSAIKHYVINPVESREASLAEFDTLAVSYETPADVVILDGFIHCGDNALQEYIDRFALAMDEADLLCCRDYFLSEQRDPSLTELRVLDTYWSDHCRHTTFSTTLDHIQLLDKDALNTYVLYLATREEMQRSKPVNLMDMATGAARYLKYKGILKNLDESPEINACTVKINVTVDGETQPWLLLFKNETHNHPTEIEPFGGAATCLGGAIRDPLSGRSYVYQAMRITGAADPLTPLCETIPGKLPQRKIVTTAAAGYSSYGNQIGLATGLVDEIYHPGYAAKHMEIGAVIGAAPEANVRREEPLPGDLVLLIGGRTGRDGCGGATGSSKSHDIHSIETCGAEVQKGNAPEERKLQRLFRDPAATRLIKRCNDFGAGGVSVAIGELADGLCINLDSVPKKYEGLDGTELAISESQERMAVVVSPADAATFIELARKENLLATVVAEVTAERRLTMHWRGKTIVDISRDFLNTNGSEKHADALVEAKAFAPRQTQHSFAEAYRKLAGDLNVCSRRGLAERFDSTIGAGSVLMPFGGKNQLTPTQVMAAKIPVPRGATTDCSVMSWGFDPYLSEQSPYHGSYLAVATSIAKLVAAGCPLERCYLTFQEYFPRLGQDPNRWGQPVAALLGTFAAQLDLGIAAIGGKDSMSGSFEELDVPPTLVSFAIAMADIRRIISPEFKKSYAKVVYLAPEKQENGLPVPESMLQIFDQVAKLIARGKIVSAYVPGQGGIAEAVMKMGFGNGFGFHFNENIGLATLFGTTDAGFVLELGDEKDLGLTLGYTTEDGMIYGCGESVSLSELLSNYENKLEKVYPSNIPTENTPVERPSFAVSSWPRSRVQTVKPRFLLPAFPGTNCEYDTANAIERAGGAAEILLVNNLTPQAVSDSVRAFCEAMTRAQAIVIPGGFSGGDEPDGSGKFITAFFRNPLISEQIEKLLHDRDGLICGICNGFQALVKLGLVPFGHIRPMDEHCPTLTYNTIGRHQSRITRTRIVSNKSPWLAKTQVDEVYSIPISHGEGRFLCEEDLLRELIANGQVATQYVDENGTPSMDIRTNPNGSVMAVEAITSPDGRVLGKMAHSERISDGIYRNVPGVYDMRIFEAAVEYFSKL